MRRMNESSLQDDILLSDRGNWMYRQILKAFIMYLPRGSWPKLAQFEGEQEQIFTE